MKTLDELKSLKRAFNEHGMNGVDPGDIGEALYQLITVQTRMELAEKALEEVAKEWHFGDVYCEGKVVGRGIYNGGGGFVYWEQNMPSLVAYLRAREASK